MVIPDTVTPYAIDTSLPGLVHRLVNIGEAWPGDHILPLTRAGFPNEMPPGTLISIRHDLSVILGGVLGEGRQSRVYELATCDQACIKLGKNARSAKQFRRELLGYKSFFYRGVLCPLILGSDSRGLFILKDILPPTLLDGRSILNSTNRILPLRYIQALSRFAALFEQDGIAIDGLPDNIFFNGNNCGSYETTTWKAPPYGNWTFAGCFLLEWLPTVVKHRSVDGWPPFRLTIKEFDDLQDAWCNHDDYSSWRSVFGQFPQLCEEWWIVE